MADLEDGGLLVLQRDRKKLYDELLLLIVYSEKLYEVFVLMSISHRESVNSAL